MLEVKPTYGFKAYISQGGYLVICQDASLYSESQKISLSYEEAIQLQLMIADYDDKLHTAWSHGVDSSSGDEDA